MPIGGTLLNTLQSENIYLSSACGGMSRAVSAGVVSSRAVERSLPTETGFFSRKEQKEHWRLACQTKVKEDMQIIVPEEVFGSGKMECRVSLTAMCRPSSKEFGIEAPRRRSDELQER